MKCLFLAAGYATRLYPLTENFPKPLLPVKGKAILDYLIDDLDTTKEIDEYIVVSNHKFNDIFVSWAKKHKQKITVIDDGTSTNETRLGAVIDIKFAIDKLNIHDDLLILAGDNLLDFSLQGFIDFAKSKNKSCVMTYKEDDTKKLQKSAVLNIDSNSGLVLDMEEKPANPKSNWCCPPFYFYKKEDIARIDEAISSGCKTDAPGSLAAWFVSNSEVHAYKMPGKRIDIGTLEIYNTFNN